MHITDWHLCVKIVKNSFILHSDLEKEIGLIFNSILVKSIALQDTSIPDVKITYQIFFLTFIVNLTSYPIK